jgi:hypothetical protein
MANKRHDWEKLQAEFNLYRAKDRSRTLKGFCKLKKLSYNHAAIKIKVYKSKEKAKEYDEKRIHIFNTTLKKHAENTGFKQSLSYIDKIVKLDELFTITSKSILNKFNNEKDFKTIYEAIKSLSLIVKSSVDLDKIKLDREIQQHSSGKELVNEEKEFFNEVLKAENQTTEEPDKEQDNNIQTNLEHSTQEPL